MANNGDPAAQKKKVSTVNNSTIENDMEKKHPGVGVESSNEMNLTKADFETAINAAGFGLYNILLILVAMPACIATVYETSTVSYILPSAECDLKLTLIDKGVLNAITYAGMISSAIIWGFLADTMGRKKLLIFGFMTDVICVLSGALSQNVIQLMIFKYLGGFVMSGPFAVLMTYLSEMHGKMFRQRVMMIAGIMFSLGQLVLPVLALYILPHQWNINFIGLQLHSWQVFLATTAVPSCISLLFVFFPESPKFLMSQGRNREALEAFKTIYALNNYKSKDSYPIKELANEMTDNRSSQQQQNSKLEASKLPTLEAKLKTSAKLRGGLQQLRPLLRKPYLKLSIWVYFLNFCTLFGHNTMRLWLPTLFASITEYELMSDKSLPSTSICTIINYSVNSTNQLHLDDTTSVIPTNNTDNSCVVNTTAASYTNNLVVAASGLFAYTIAGFLVNLIGVKTILSLGLFITCVCNISMYWSSSSISTVIIASISVTMGSMSSTSVISASVNLFPTSLRTMIVSLEMMFGRLGSLLGNICFPALMSLGCIPPFLMISLFMFTASLLSAFLPIKNKEILK